MIGQTVSLDAGASTIAGSNVRGKESWFRKTLFLPIALSLIIHAGVGLMLIGQTFHTAPPRLLDGPAPTLHVTWLSAPNVAAITKTSAPASTENEAVLTAADRLIRPVPLQVDALPKAVPELSFTKAAAIPDTPFRVAPKPATEPTFASVSGSAQAKAPAASAGSVTAAAPATLRHSAPARGQGEAPAIVLPRYRENDVPAYPIVARLRGYEGVVLIAAQVSTQGRVQTIRVKKSSGYAVLDRSAEEAVKSWRFEPGRQMGVPMTMWVDVPVRFVLRDQFASSDASAERSGRSMIQ